MDTMDLDLETGFTGIGKLFFWYRIFNGLFRGIGKSTM